MAWRTQWDSYSSLSGLAREDTTKQVKGLTLCLSREMLAIVHNLGLSEEQMKQPDAVIQATYARIYRWSCERNG